jgi:pyruvate carboxylase
VMEAMKMQTTVYAPVSGKVTERLVQVGQTVDAKDLLMVLSPAV